MWNYPLWFLVAFFVCKCLVDWIMQIAYTRSTMLKAQSHREIVFFCAAGAICFVLGLYLASIRKGFFYPFRADIGITMVPFMLVGYFMKDFYSSMETERTWRKLGLAFLSLAINFIAFYNNSLVSVNSSDYGNPALFALGAISGSSLVLFLCQAISGISAIERVLAWYGKNSLVIMCTHVIVLLFISKCLVMLNRFTGVPNEVLGILEFFFCCLLMIPCVVCLEFFSKCVKQGGI